MRLYFFNNERGVSAPLEFIRGLDKRSKRQLGEDLKFIQEMWSSGKPVGEPLVKKISPGLWELRRKTVEGFVRLLFTVGKDEIVVLHGFIKKERKTPQAELAIANKRLQQLRR